MAASISTTGSNILEAASSCSSSVSPDLHLPEQNSIESGIESAGGLQQQQSCSRSSLESSSPSSPSSSGLGSSPLGTSLLCLSNLANKSSSNATCEENELGLKCGKSESFACIDCDAGNNTGQKGLQDETAALDSPSAESRKLPAKDDDHGKACTICTSRAAPTTIGGQDEQNRPAQMAVAQCNRCQNLMCPKCVIAHDLIHCSENRLVDPLPMSKAYFDQIQALVCNSREEMTRLHSAHELVSSKLEKNYTNICNNVHEQFELLTRILDIRKNDLLKKIENDCGAKQSSLAQSKSRIASFVEQTVQLADFTEGLLLNALKGHISLVESPLRKKLVSIISASRRECSLLQDMDTLQLELLCNNQELQNYLRSAVILQKTSNNDAGSPPYPTLPSKKQPPISRPTTESSSKLKCDASLVDQNALGLSFLNMNEHGHGCLSNYKLASNDNNGDVRNSSGAAPSMTTSLSNSLAQSIASFADRSHSITEKKLLAHDYQTPAAAAPGYFPASSIPTSSSQLPLSSLESHLSKPYSHLISKSSSPTATSDLGFGRTVGARALSHPYETWAASASDLQKRSVAGCGVMELGVAATGLFVGAMDIQENLLSQQNSPQYNHHVHHQSLLGMSRFSGAAVQQPPFQQSQFGMVKGADMLAAKLAAAQPMFPPKSQIKRQKMIYHCKFGEFGVLEGQFTEPSGVTVNAQNDIIVADTNNHRIQIFDKEGRFKFQFGECGKRDGQLLYPNRVAVVRQSGDIVVTERSPTHQVQIYNQYGQFVRKFGANILQHPRGVCVDNKGFIIVVECKVMRVIIFDQLGNVLSKFGCSKHLEFPNGVVVNDRQEIFISDNRAHCVKVFSYEGVYLRQIGGEGITNYPIGVGINAAGEITIADNHNNFNLSVFSQEGTLLSALESKVKHAQCFDVSLMDEGSVVLASKDYRLYIYRYIQLPQPGV